jgi:hypothetical protein
MKCVLSTEIAVMRVAVFAEMAWMERRPELGLICRAARENGYRFTRDIVQALLPGLQNAGENNVIAWCKMLGLCDGHGGLTALGEDVADADEAPVPEQGVYGLWLAQHPLLGRRVLAAERLAASRDQRFESITPLAMEPDRGRVFRSVLNGKERFLLRDLPANHDESGGLVLETKANCRLRWTLDFDQARDQWQLEGVIDAPQSNGKNALSLMQHEPESDGLDLWGLASTWAMGPLSAFGQWRTGERRLVVPFDGLAASEVDTFRKTLILSRVQVPGKGVYENVTLEDVPIGPQSARDAQLWAMARFDRKLSLHPAYRSRAAVREQFTTLAEETPLEAFEPTLPSHEELLRQATRDSARFWSLAAPVDLSPFPVESDLLGELRLGAPPAIAVSEPPGVVRIPYRGNWSMRQLVDRLLSGAVPGRVLLCDRYVRGHNNLVALKLLVEAFRDVAPGVVLDVWTEDVDPEGREIADFKKVQQVSATSPRSYREAFGRSRPHDRYLLVLPVFGSGFGWQMSNSPLDAQASVTSPGSDTQLRWRDFAATRVGSDELVPALGQWFNGGGR